MGQSSDKPKKEDKSGIGKDDSGLLEALEQAAAAIDVDVRYDRLVAGDVKTTSGYCKIRGVDTIILDRRLGVRERIAALSRELRRFNFDNLYLPPAVRSLVEGERADRGEASKT